MDSDFQAIKKFILDQNYHLIDTTVVLVNNFVNVKHNILISGKITTFAEYIQQTLNQGTPELIFKISQINKKKIRILTSQTDFCKLQEIVNMHLDHTISTHREDDKKMF